MKKLSVLAIGGIVSMAAYGESIALSDLSGIENITSYTDATAKVRANLSTQGNPLTIEGKVYESGIGAHAPSVTVVKLNGATAFSAVLGVDDEADLKADHGIVDYTVTAYGSSLADATTVVSGTLNRQTPSYHYNLDMPDLTGYQYLKIDFQPGSRNWADHVDIADAFFTYSGVKPEIVAQADMFADESNIVYLPTEATLEGAQILPLSTLELENITNGWGTIRANKSIDNNPLRMKGKTYKSGIGIHADALVAIKLNGSSPKFHCELGIDDEVASACTGNAKSNVGYTVKLRDAAGKETVLYSGTINYNDASTVAVDIDDLSKYKYLIMKFDNVNTNEYDHVDIGNAYFEFVYQNSNAPEIVPEKSLSAGLDAATTLFSQPGVRFMHKLRSQNSDAVISVENLPEGLTFNERRSLIEGKIDAEGVYTYNVKVATPDDVTVTPVTLTVSSSLQQPVPFMGWLSWNSIEGNISGSVIKSVADQMESKGLIDAGYNYLVIDDLWHADKRAADGTPVEHPTKFPEGLKASADYVHGKGMKFGIYSDAATKTCAGAYGSLGYETQDANQYAKWGVDLLKYDYCGAPTDLESARTRYTAMGDALKASGRDIIFYICEWGVREPWKWGAEAGGTCWRATYDTRDCWRGSTGGIGILQTIDVMKDIWHYSGVNRWNDADMMMLGINGTGKSSSHLCATGPGMTKDEYRTQMALWCMWQSPLTLSNDMSQPISDEDLAIMTNSELIAINQDRMGQAAETVSFKANESLFLTKDCENGDIVVSVTNLSAAPKAFTLDLAEVSAATPGATYICRDVVNHVDLPELSGIVDFGTVPSHATAVFRLTDKEKSGINAVTASKSLEKMTVSLQDDTLRVCLPGTAGATKSLMLSDVYGHIIANAVSSDECYSFPAPASKGVYLVQTVCAAHAQVAKLLRN